MNDCKRKNKLLAYVIALMSIISMALPMHAEASETESNKGTPENPYMIATDVTFAPFEFQNSDGEYVGIDIELLTAIAEDQGFEFELRPLNFSAGLQALESNQVDGMIAAMGITPEREESFDFSDPYFESGPAMAVAETNEEISTYADLEGKTVAVKVGTTGAEYAAGLQEEYNFEINQFEDSASMYEDVAAGHSDAAFEDYPVMAYAIQQGLKLKLPVEPEGGDYYGFAVNKDQNPELLEKFNAGLVNIQQDGTYDDIVEKYLGSNQESSSTGTGIVALIANNWKSLASGLWATLVLTLVSFGIALVLGTILGLFSAGSNKVLNAISGFYLTIMRGVPLIVLAFFVYFSVPQLLNIQMSAFLAGVITLTLNSSAYISEQVRGGIQAVSVGQLEAGRSLGLSYNKTMTKIILPQAIKIMVPSLINQFVITLKDTSILSVIGIVELTQTGRIIIARTYSSGSMWFVIGAMYIIVITILTWLSTVLERRLTNA